MLQPHPLPPRSRSLSHSACVLQLAVRIKTSRNLVKNHSAKQIRNIQICTVSFVLTLRIRAIEETPKNTNRQREREREQERGKREVERAKHIKSKYKPKGKQSAQNGIDQPSEQPLGQQQQQQQQYKKQQQLHSIVAEQQLLPWSVWQLSVSNCSQFSVNFLIICYN